MTTADNNGIIHNEVRPLSERMRLATKNVHDKSDKLVNLKLAMVLTSKELYAEAISLFWPIYAELEYLIEHVHKNHEQLKLLCPIFKIIRRAPRFEKDIQWLLNDDKHQAQNLLDKRKHLKIMTKADKENKNNGNKNIIGNSTSQYSPPELQEYIDHLHKLSKDNPICLLSYVFHMYGAIMAGGFIIKKTVKTAFALKTDKGVETFVVDIEGTPFANVKALRQEIKRIVDQDMNLSVGDQEAILKESPMVFVRNNKLVATVKDSSAYESARNQCFVFTVIASAIIVGLLAIATKLSFSK